MEHFKVNITLVYGNKGITTSDLKLLWAIKIWHDMKRSPYNKSIRFFNTRRRIAATFLP